jgi:hypothetical protein
MFIIKCTECGREWQINSNKDISDSPIYAAGYEGQIGIQCKCKHGFTEDE